MPSSRTSGSSVPPGIRAFAPMPWSGSLHFASSSWRAPIGSVARGTTLTRGVCPWSRRLAICSRMISRVGRASMAARSSLRNPAPCFCRDASILAVCLLPYLREKVLRPCAGLLLRASPPHSRPRVFPYSPLGHSVDAVLKDAVSAYPLSSALAFSQRIGVLGTPSFFRQTLCRYRDLYANGTAYLMLYKLNIFGNPRSTGNY